MIGRARLLNPSLRDADQNRPEATQTWDELAAARGKFRDPERDLPSF
jgi:hypothetical protein